MNKIAKNRMGIALFLLVSLLLVAPPAIAEDVPGRAPTAAVDSSYPPLGTFVPVSPCRAVDTRNAARWGFLPILPGGTFSVWLYGLPNGQGGVSGNCVPFNAQAVAINLTAIPQSGQGFLTVWRYGDARPLASSINYSSFISQNAIANGIVVPMCPNCDNELNVYNFPGSTHFIIDVTGYWLP